ncbi:unnamed protein product [Didymodactylos carnosus]|uniref:Vint domain-containing protein n=1 Tax=Didymodactylos carnosus TaxID=1234261 RepID=A0A814JHF0_9BILA|nr:unnamed protein product [Didymodactylos carnosus]CAF1035912.1 unnamed protein product [Didymodactylos carnosus]CAF3530001.1 unnamed protein product [Didymodactylos carnosus]CAF3806489.1 unnamed protein product [Didymodactylos carnosus]
MFARPIRGGTYSFIPDGGFVGTVFVNALSGVLTTVATNVSLEVKPTHEHIFLGDNYTAWYNSEKSDDGGKKFHIGSIMYGQSKDLIIPITTSKDHLDSPYLTVSLNYTSQSKKVIVNCMVHADTMDAQPGMVSRDIMIHQQRLEFVKQVQMAKNYMEFKSIETAQKTIKTFEEEIKSSSVQNDPFIIDLVKDLTGQVYESLSKQEWFARWGKHYLPSLTRAHLLQICNNFKDPGVQHYGGELFNKLRDEIDDIFCKLPAPKPSVRQRSASPIQMTNFYNASAGCFHGDCLVLLANGSTKLVKYIRKGDVLKTANSLDGTTVKYVAKSICSNGKVDMVNFDSGLIISPWHPVRINGNWIFPCDIGNATEIKCAEVYNFALDSHHIVIVNGVECVTLGHNFKGKVIEHPYYGTSAILDDLRDLDRSGSGFIELMPNWFIRDVKTTGLVSRISTSLNVGG